LTAPGCQDDRQVFMSCVVLFTHRGSLFRHDEVFAASRRHSPDRQNRTPQTPARSLEPALS
jgi:hypothetical protein